MTHFPTMPLAFISVACGLLSACGGGGAQLVEAQPVVLTATGPNAVTAWAEIAASTANGAAAATGTPEEQRPITSVDLATVHLAIYDTVMAIDPTHQPFAVTPATAAAGASQEAAIAAAAYGVLRGLFPARGASYQAAYDSYVAALPDGDAKTRGLAVGTEVAARMVALRANDGRSVVLAPYVPGSNAGQFRGTNPIGRFNSAVKPFSLTSASQFRAPGLPALDSAAYAKDVNETRALGSANSTTRTPEQTELARFATEPPGINAARNITNLAKTSASLGEHARLLAMVWVAQADVTIACFESKYHYEAWRPSSAITLAGSYPNAGIIADPAWTPVVATPNHPEYPAAHSCASSALGEALRGFYGTSQITFDVDSTVSGTKRHYTSTTAFIDDMGAARIAGGMHLRTSTVDGAALGKNVANWVTAHHFQAK
jgi:hypothetical protein